MTTSPLDDPAFRLRTAMLGFYGARRRYGYKSEKKDAVPEDVFIPLTEALWWAVSVDEGFTDLDGAGYEQDRDQDTRGQVFRGLRYARNRCGHQRAIVAELKEGGHGFPVSFPVSFDPRVLPVATCCGAPTFTVPGPARGSRVPKAAAGEADRRSARLRSSVVRHRPESARQRNEPWAMAESMITRASPRPTIGSAHPHGVARRVRGAAAPAAARAEHVTDDRRAVVGGHGDGFRRSRPCRRTPRRGWCRRGRGPGTRPACRWWSSTASSCRRVGGGLR
jgi:hypothetical protein